MSRLQCVVVLFVASFVIANSVKVTIYYEAFCGDSVDFITNQLYPAYSELSSDLVLEFVPYGKARHYLVNGKWQFDCQHGPEECYANKFQACALAQGNGQDKDLEFIACVMNTRRPSSKKILSKCAKRANIAFQPINYCASSSEGDELLVKYGNTTHALRPSISFVPTIVYNDKFDNDLQYKSLSNFLDTVCSVINDPYHKWCKSLTKIQPHFYDYDYNWCSCWW